MLDSSINDTISPNKGLLILGRCCKSFLSHSLLKLLMLYCRSCLIRLLVMKWVSRLAQRDQDLLSLLIGVHVEDLRVGLLLSLRESLGLNYLGLLGLMLLLLLSSKHCLSLSLLTTEVACIAICSLIGDLSGRR
jgi:hypothetical protein